MLLSKQIWLMFATASMSSNSTIRPTETLPTAHKSTLDAPTSQTSRDSSQGSHQIRPDQPHEESQHPPQPALQSAIFPDPTNHPYSARSHQCLLAGQGR